MILLKPSKTIFNKYIFISFFLFFAYQLNSQNPIFIQELQSIGEKLRNEAIKYFQENNQNLLAISPITNPGFKEAQIGSTLSNNILTILNTSSRNFDLMDNSEFEENISIDSIHLFAQPYPRPFFRQNLFKALERQNIDLLLTGTWDWIFGDSSEYALILNIRLISISNPKLIFEISDTIPAKGFLRSQLVFTLNFEREIISGTTAAPQPIQKIADKFIGLSSQHVSSPKHKKEIDNFWTTVKFLREQEEDQKRLKGTATFGFNKNDSRDINKFDLNGGIKITRGTYPGEFQFSTDVRIEVNNGQFQENVSDMFISYDYFPRRDYASIKPNKKYEYYRENFIFLNRFTDRFLGIEQRYQVGAGLIWSWWKKKMTTDGDKKKKKLYTLEFSDDFANRDWYRCVKDACQDSELKEPTKKDVQDLKNAQRRTETAILTKYSKCRLAILVGVFAETEKTMASDSLEFIDGDSTLIQFFSREFDATQDLRAEVRPTFDWRISDNWSLSFRPYIIYPLQWKFWELNKSEVRPENFDGIDDDNMDWRLDSRITLNINLSQEDDFQNKKVGIALEYRYLYDNAPPRIYLDKLNQQDEPILLSASKEHHIVNLKFSLDF